MMPTGEHTEQNGTALAAVCTLRVCFSIAHRRLFSLAFSAIRLLHSQDPDWAMQGPAWQMQCLWFRFNFRLLALDSNRITRY